MIVQLLRSLLQLKMIFKLILYRRYYTYQRQGVRVASTHLFKVHRWRHGIEIKWRYKWYAKAWVILQTAFWPLISYNINRLRCRVCKTVIDMFKYSAVISITITICHNLWPIRHWKKFHKKAGNGTLNSIEKVMLQLAYDIDVKDAVIPADVKVIEWNNDIISAK